MSQREIAGVLGVDHKTVCNDLHAGENSPKSSDRPGRDGENSPKPSKPAVTVAAGIVAATGRLSQS